MSDSELNYYTKKHLIYTMSARFVKIEKLGKMINGGERTNFHYMGNIEGNNISGVCRGIDYAEINNGLISVNVRESITTPLAGKIYIERKGYSILNNEPSDIIIVGSSYIAETNSEDLLFISDSDFKWEAKLNWNSENFSLALYKLEI